MVRLVVGSSSLCFITNYFTVAEDVANRLLQPDFEDMWGEQNDKRGGPRIAGGTGINFSYFLFIYGFVM